RIGVSIESFTVIYDLEKRVEELLIAHAPRITKEETVGEAKILKTFNSTTKKHVAGARLVSGVVSIGSDAKVMRRNVEIGRGKITNLQQARADVKEIRTEGEFGFEIETKASVAPGDAIVLYRIVEE
ncbi:hypothetical protein MNBD_CPR01-79, partial [hydrothermal vent metagenome]